MLSGLPVPQKKGGCFSTRSRACLAPFLIRWDSREGLVSLELLIGTRKLKQGVVILED